MVNKKYALHALMLSLPVTCNAALPIANWDFSEGSQPPVLKSVQQIDDFSEVPNMQNLGGTWLSESGFLKQTDAAAEGSKSVFSDQQFSNFELNTTIRLDSASNSSGNAGVIFNASNLNESVDGVRGYYVGLNLSGQVVLGKMDNNWKQIASSSYQVSLNQVYDLRLVSRNNTLQVFVNNELKLVQDIPDFTSGKIGFRTYKAASSFGAVEITNDSDTLLSYRPELNWEDLGGEWAKSQGVLVQSSGNAKDYGIKRMLETEDVRNFTISADVTPTSSGQSGSNVGLIFRVQNAEVGQDSMQGYYVGIDDGDKIVFGKMNNNWNLLSETPFEHELNQTYNLKVVAADDEFNVYVDGQKVMTVNDTEWREGRVGLRTHKAAAEFDNVNLVGASDAESNAVHSKPYLMAYFKGNSLSREKIFYAKSYDALLWEPLNDDNYVFDANDYSVRIRDPYIQKVVRNGVEKYHMVHTKGWDNTGIYHWESDDLINWTGQYLNVMEGTGAPNAWAPEFTYDPDEDKFYVYWTSRTPRKKGEGGQNGEVVNSSDPTEKIWYITTQNWVDYPDPQVYFYPGFDIIDANIIKVDGEFQMVYKTEFGSGGSRHLLLAKSSSLNPEVQRFTGTEEFLPEISGVEGPEQLKVNVNGESKIYMYYDFFAHGGYWGASEKSDGEWRVLPRERVSFPARARHGSVVEIEWSEMAALPGNGFGRVTGLVTDLRKEADGFYFRVDGDLTTASCNSTGEWFMPDSGNGTVLRDLVTYAHNNDIPVNILGQGRCLYGQNNAETPAAASLVIE